MAVAEAGEYSVDVAKTKLAVEAFQRQGEESRYLAERRDEQIFGQYSRPAECAAYLS